jgi:hypothetical protein
MPFDRLCAYRQLLVTLSQVAIGFLDLLLTHVIGKLKAFGGFQPKALGPR